MNSAAPHKVLIVDDEADLCASLREILTARDYQVACAASTEAALAALDDLDPTVALIDVRLGDENGLDLLGAMREKRPALIAVMMSGYAEYDIAMAALRGGAYDYLVKPIHPDALMVVLNRCYDRLFREAQMQLAYQQLIKAKEESQAAARAKAKFLALMSRELRTPLNSIIGFSEMLNAQMFGPIGNGRYAEYAGHIAQTGRQLYELISRIIDQSAIDAGTMELSDDTVDLAALVDSCIATVRGNAEAADKSFDIRLPAQPILFLGDKKRLTQAVLAIIGNAVRFNRPWGRISVSLTINHDRDAEIKIEDTGIGIPAEDLPKLFQPFTRLSSGELQARQGSGLGLSLAASFVKLHRGSIRVESQPGAGTTVRIVLPGDRLTARLPTERAAADERRGPGLRRLRNPSGPSSRPSSGTPSGPSSRPGSGSPSGPSSGPNSGTPSGPSSGEQGKPVRGPVVEPEPWIQAAPLIRR